MLLEKGEKILIAHRRLYETDIERYFLGVVDAYDQGVARVTGYTWQHDVIHGRLVRKEDKRCKILSLTSGGLFCYVLAAHLDIETLHIEQHKQRLLLTDGNTVALDISDRVPSA